MLTGDFTHSIDEKGRLIIPAKFRNALGEHYVVCNGRDGCMFLYSVRQWEEFAEKLNKLPQMEKDTRLLHRHFFGSSAEGSFDKQGRASIPASLRERFGLDKEVVLVGSYNYVEIWSKERWDAFNHYTDEDLEASSDALQAKGYSF